MTGNKDCKKKLVPLDGSTLAESALEQEKANAAGCNVPDVVLFRVVEPAYAISDALFKGAVIYIELTDQIQKDVDNYIDNVTNTFKLQTGINTKSVLAYGNAANEILDYVKNNQLDLIVMTTHGRSGVSRCCSAA